MSHWTTLQGTIQSYSQKPIILGNIIFLDDLAWRLHKSFLLNTLYRAYLHLKLVGFKLIKLNGKLVYPPQGSEEGFIWTKVNKLRPNEINQEIYFCSSLRNVTPNQLLLQTQTWLSDIQQLNNFKLYGESTITDGQTTIELEVL
jgi:hypothetical protein